MDDWRIRDQELYLNNAELYKIQFPDFWLHSYKNKNDFYKSVLEDARSFVDKYKRGQEKLSGISVSEFWHTHCDFCLDKIDTEQKRLYYCTKDYDSWICEDCYNDFCRKFNWRVVDRK